MRLRILLTSLAALCLGVTTLGASPGEPTPHAFVGVDGCKLCHKSADKGDQYGTWLASRHATAYATLAGAKAKQFATARGLDDEPQKLDECLSCHVTGHGAPAALLGAKHKLEDGVGCESCHGPGADYKKKAVMEDHAASLAAGLSVIDEKTCTRCHNAKSPAFVKFDYAAALQKVAHHDPTQTPVGTR